ncbi:hypothetical protein ACOKM5_44405 [Streptomyces sp. BH097]|uniref:hypothetical protein n=1 Tax=Streptomyces sp. BH097 TaxID=3410406 RepID=UPI003CE9D29B
MNKPPFFKQVLSALARKGWAYDTHDEVTQALREDTTRLRIQHFPAHQTGAQNIVQQLGFQPGLVKVHAETEAIGIYLEALALRARDLGYATLAYHLQQAMTATYEASQQISSAAHGTIPGAEVPTQRTA